MAAIDRDPAHRPRPRAGRVLAAGLSAIAGTTARGDDSTADFRFLHFGESDGRTQVENPEIYFTHSFGEKGQVGLLLSYDSISGASPTGEAPVLDATASASSAGDIPLADYSDTRQAASVSYARRFGQHMPSVTLSYSKESDYLSRGASLVETWDLFAGRSTLRLGAGLTRDRVEPVTLNESFDKGGQSYTAGWTQVLGQRDLIDVSLGLERLDGYLTDPYKKVPVAGVAVPEVRPDSRSRHSAILKYGHYFMTRSALKTSYRYYWDDWDVRAHTLDLTFDQRLGGKLIVTPRLRYYNQGAASFFAYEFDSAQPFMSSDYRLSSFWSWLAGLGLTFEVNDRLSFNIGATYQEQTGLDRTTPIPAAGAPLLRGVGLAAPQQVEDEDEDEDDEGPGTVSAADLTTITGTLGFTVRF